MHPNEALARRDMELLMAGDVESAAALYTPDCVVHYPGRSPLAGTHIGLEAFIGRVMELLDGGNLERRLHDVLASDDHAIQLLEVTAEAKGHSHTWRAMVLMHVTDGRFSEMWFSVDDQYALDEFLSSLED